MMMTRCPHCDCFIAAAVCTCIVASAAAPAKQWLYEAADLPHVHMEDARPAPLPIAGQFDRDRRAPTEANPHFIARPWPQPFAISAAYRSNAATD
jgi:hypothetical protein